MPDNAYAGGGAFAQQCTIMPDRDAVVAITAGVRLSAAQSVNDLVWKHLFSQMGESPLSENKAAHETLLRKLEVLSIRPPTGQSDSPLAADVSGRRFEFPENDHQMRSIVLTVEPSHALLTLVDGRGEHVIVCGYGRWTNGRTKFDAPVEGGLEALNPDRVAPCAASGAWTADDTFTVKLCYTESAPISTLTLRFEPGKVAFDKFVNIKPMERMSLVGNAS